MKVTSAGWLSTLLTDSAPDHPDFLAIGHVSKDVHERAFTIGGTVTFAGLLACRLGLRTAVVTSYGEELPVREVLGHLQLSTRYSATSTTFENVYEGSHRHQHILGVADAIGLSDVPPVWRSAPIVLLGPIAGEIRLDLFTAFSGSLLGLTPQGMLREWDETGRVRPAHWEVGDHLLQQVDVLILSEDDLPDRSELDRYVKLVDIVAVTDSERGAVVYERGQPRKYPAYPCMPVDPTGAGDTFAAAFLIELQRTGSLDSAAHFANAAASFVIEAPGVTGLPDRSQVEARLAAGPVDSLSSQR
ncbi:MAG: PfkB family carbohydrate kinase [Chloroflexota bacterium]|nr:PfkB family carbohydrate kinase [Chloroflexota bacterium]